jgi:hypothetical protein
MKMFRNGELVRIREEIVVTYLKVRFWYPGGTEENKKTMNSKALLLCVK